MRASDVPASYADGSPAKVDKDSQALLVRVRKRAKAMFDHDELNRELALNDLRFLHVPGEQWDAHVRRERGDLRPMYEFNKLRITVKRIVNDMRANRPQGKVRAVEDGDKPTANVYEGLIRNIWNVSDGDTVIDQAAEYQVGGGMGAWRVCVDYADDEAFDQDICVKAIRNPFCLYADNAAQDSLKRDAMDWILTEKISKASFETRWPGIDAISFDDVDFDDEEDWEDEAKIRICEYWWKEPYEKTVQMLSNGETVDAAKLEEGELERLQLTVTKERTFNCYKIMMCIVGGGNRMLSAPTEWAGAEFPFVLIYGESVVIDGKTSWFGLTRFGKDAQRSYNYSRTNAIESVALAPQAKWWATADQATGLTDQWAVAHKTNMPFMLYNPDPKSPGPPARMGGADVPTALIQEMEIASEDIKAVTGIYDASLGAQGNETSGKAINARQRQGEIATFNYMDNMGKGIRRTWEILVDLIPKIYDTERSVRILGHDGAEDYAKVNTIDPKTGKALNDLSTGKYDVTITIGPSFATLRQEASEAYGELATRDPMLMQAAGDLVFKAMDLPYAEQIAERYQAMLPPPIQQMLVKGKHLPPEVTAAMAQVQQMSQMVDQKGQLVTAAEQELKELQAAAKSDKAGAQLAAAHLKGQEAHLEGLRKDLDLAQANLDNERALLAKETENAILQIQLAESGANQRLALSNQDAVHQISTQAHKQDMANTNAEHALILQSRDVQDALDEAQQSLNDQSTTMKMDAMQISHSQDLKAAKAASAASKANGARPQA